MLSYAPATVYPIAVFDTGERTASRTTSESFRQLHQKIARSTEASEFLIRLRAFDDLVKQLTDLRFIEDGWNSYASPKPLADSIQAAQVLLELLRRHDILASRVLPSAEGGVAITFTSSTTNRALIETLNGGETFLLLYNRSGDSETIEFTPDPNFGELHLARLKLHLRGAKLAAS